MTATETLSASQKRHEAPELGDAIVRMMRALVTRAEEGDWEAIEQLARIESLAPTATSLGMRSAHDAAGYSYTELGAVLGVSRQAARQRSSSVRTWGVGHVLVPGHTKRGCMSCSSTELQA